MRVKKSEIVGKGLDQVLQGKFDKYQFQVGILQNKQHYAPARKLVGFRNGNPVYEKSWYNFAGIQLLRAGNKVDGTLKGVAKEMDEAYKWLRRPWEISKNKDLIGIIHYIVEDINGRENKQRILNGIQAVVRNPILRGDYGKNSRKRAKEKGFNKLMMATGQFFKNIKARFI